MKRRSHLNLEQSLYEIAEAQNGYFTALQAKQVGYNYRNFGYYVAKKQWEKKNRGLYRLARYPLNEEDQYTEYSLWIGEENGTPIGVYSHQTALSIHDLSPVIPNKLHITVPPTYKTARVIPALLYLHKGEVKEEETLGSKGYRVTTLERTLKDLAIANSIERGHLAEAIITALKRGLITKTWFFNNPEFFPLIPHVFKQDAYKIIA